MNPRILIVGVGNVLLGDDGFGIEAARRLQEQPDLPEGVRVIETGIGGISLVQELMDDWDTLVVLDAMKSPMAPGTLKIQALEVADLRDSPVREQQNFLADVHYANPARALMLARALDRLPQQVYLLGCVASADDRFGSSMSPPVEEATREAAALLTSWLKGSLTLEEVNS